jgi:hypothetical protein
MGEDLGIGVYVSPAENGQLVVTSPRLDLGWRVVDGQVPGTAVMWHDEPFEVAARTAAGNGHRWTLRPWPVTGTMRDVVTLDSQFVASTAAKSTTERRGHRNRVGTTLLLPFFGLVPARVQERWQSEWLFPAELATWLSAALELLSGGFGVIQLAALAFGGEWFLPFPLRFLALVGPLMVGEAMVRLVLVAARSEPVGSVVGLPLLVFETTGGVAAPATVPEVRSFDRDRGVLELVSPMNRVDWDHDGLLPYRDTWFILDRVDREGRSWTYHFVRSEDGPGGRRVLRLHPPVETPFAAPRDASPPPSILKTTLVTAAVTFGSRAEQERWARHLGVHARWLTMASSAAELAGGLINLGRDAAVGGYFFVIFDVVLIVEGSWRLLSALRGRPAGSVFGWIFRPLYRSSLGSVDATDGRS